MESSIFAQVHAIVAEIPEGSVATYGQIAAMVGNPRGARTVVWALRNAKDHALPFHRVVAKSGRLSPDHVFGGAAVQRQLLEAEGVSFSADGSIIMERHQWLP